MAVSETNTKVDVLAAKKAVLRQRGVPEKFIQGIAGIETLDKSQDKAMARMIVPAFAGLTVLILGGVWGKKHIVNWLFAGQISHSDLFVSGGGLIAAWLWLIISLGLLLPWIGLLLTPREIFRYGLRGEIQPVRAAAFWLCSRQGQRLGDIAADPRFATLADLKSPKAFLEDVGGRMMPDQLAAQDREERKTQRRGVAIFAAWLPITLAIGAWGLDNYTRIDHGTITYVSPTGHVSVPLAQVTRVDAYCYFGGRHSDRPRLAYHISFRGHSIDLFQTDNLRDEADTVNRLARIDTYLKAQGVAMDKTKPFDQLTPRQQRCLDETGLGPQAVDPKKHQLIFG